MILTCPAAAVGVDAHIAPAERTLFMEIYGKFTTFQRAYVGIGPYKSIKIAANIAE